MEVAADIQAPEQQEQQQTPPQTDPVEKYYNYLKKAGADVAPSIESFKRTLSDDKSAQQYYNYLKQNKYDAPPTYGSFARTLGITESATPPAAVVPEHQIAHTPIQDLRHLSEMADKPVATNTTVLDPLSGSSIEEPDKEGLAAQKAYQTQYDKSVQDLSKTWGTDPAATKNVLKDFPDEQDEAKLKTFAGLATENPVSYARLKNANDIRVAIAKDGPNGVNDANVFNHLQNAGNYQQLTEENIPYQQQLMRAHGLGSDAFDKLRETQRPLINSTNPEMLAKMWNGPDKELGLTDDEYAGLETERLFNPGKAKIDEGILKHARGIGDDGKANPVDLSTQPYEYRRGLENVRYGLELLGRDNKQKYLLENKSDVDKQVDVLKNDYQQKVNNATSPQDQQALIQEFANHPIVQEANKLEDAAQDLQYSRTEDERRYPLNFSDQATRAVKEAMDNTTGFMGNAAHFGGNILQGAGESADNTMRWIKNIAINLAGNEQQVSFNNAKNIGHQALTELSSYEPTSYTGRETPLNVPRETISAVQGIFKDPNLTDDQKQQQAISYVRDHFNELTVNPKAGQQNLTGKAALFQSANVMGQILGVANQSFLLGGAIGDASKLQQMANAFTPMYMSTQNQMYEQALKNGDEHPLLKSNIDAAIISLASLINPDIKIVKGMVGAETGLGKMIAGIDESTWNSVLSKNRPVVDRMIGTAKATGRQLGLANLQYGVIVPTAQYLAHKSILNEDSNLGDAIKDAVIQTNVSMALPALLHGVWGGLRASEVNPNQKYSIVEAGLHSDQNIDLVESKIKAGVIPEIQGHEMKQVIKHAGEILQNTEMVKTDGTPMNENEVADVVYNELRKGILEDKFKTASDPNKPIIKARIHEIDKEIADLHTSEDQKHKTELNALLSDNLDKIKEGNPSLEQSAKDAIAQNRPEDIFTQIHNEASETKSVEGKEVSSRPEAEEKYGKELVKKAYDLSKKEVEPIPEPHTAQAEEPQVNSEPITNKTEDNAIPEPSPEGQIPRTGSGGENIPNGSEGMGQSQQGNETSPALPQAEQTNGEVSGQEKVNPDELPFGDLPVGIAHHLQEQRSAAELNVLPPERGEGTTPEQSIQRGKVLIASGSNPDQVIADFKKDKRLSSDDMAVVRARYNELAQKTNKAYDQYGDKSPQANAAFTAERAWYNDAVKPMQTEWSKIGTAQQGAVDLDTSTVTSIKRAFSEQSGKPTTPRQSDIAKDFHAKIKEQDNIISKLQKKLDGLHNPTEGKKPSKNYVKERKDSFQAARDALKKLRTGESGVGVSIPLVRELAAIAPHIGNIVKSFIAEGIDRLGDIVDRIHDELKDDIPGLRRRDVHDLIAGDFNKTISKSPSAIDEKYGDLKKQSRLVKKLEDLQNGLPEDFDKNKTDQSPEVKKLLEQIKKVKKDLDAIGYMKKPKEVKVPDTPEQKNIKRLEKQLDDIQQGNYKYNDRREPSEKEKELRDQIFEAKKKLGVIPSKQLSPEEEGRIEQEKISELAGKFVDKKDNVFTNDESNAIWDHTKKVIGNGATDFHDVVNQVAMDTGLTTEQVRRAIAQPKGAKTITDEMYAAMYRRNQVLQSAKVWVKSADQSEMKKFWNKVIKVPSAIVTFGHGSVAPITHVGADLYRPSNWKSYFNFMLDSYKYSFGGVTDAGKARYEKAMGDLVRDPMYMMAKRAGLKIDPTDLSGDDYSKYQGVFGRIAKMGERGFNAMKPYRLEQFKKTYNSLTDQAKASPDVVKAIAHMVNLSSGTTDAKIPPGADVVMFAPKLVVSQYQRIFSEPAKAVGTFVKWGSSSDADKLQAKMVARHAGEMVATYAALLAANQAILSMTGSKQKINFTNPLDSDWMKFKAGNKTVDASGGMNSALRFVVSLAEEGARANGIMKTTEKGKPGDTEGRKILQQMTNKLSPFAGDIAEGFSGTDMVGRPLPWSSVKPSAGKEKLSWSDYLETKLPIPVAEGMKTFNEAAKEQGMPKSTLDKFLEAVIVGGAAGTTGAKVGPDKSTEKKESGRKLRN